LSVIATDGALKEVSDDELLVLVGNGGRDALSISPTTRQAFNVSHRILKDKAESLHRFSFFGNGEMNAAFS
jgi:hypothetical protein